MTPRDREALRRIADDIAKIHVYVAQAGAGWAGNDMAVDAIAKRLEDIGENAKVISAEVLVREPEVDWIGAKAMRDVLAHECHDLEVEIVTQTVEADLPALKNAVDRLLA